MNEQGAIRFGAGRAAEKSAGGAGGMAVRGKSFVSGREKKALAGLQCVHLALWVGAFLCAGESAAIVAADRGERGQGARDRGGICEARRAGAGGGGEAG